MKIGVQFDKSNATFHGRISMQCNHCANIYRARGVVLDPSTNQLSCVCMNCGQEIGFATVVNSASTASGR